MMMCMYDIFTGRFKRKKERVYVMLWCANSRNDGYEKETRKIKSVRERWQRSSISFFPCQVSIIPVGMDSLLYQHRRHTHGEINHFLKCQLYTFYNIIAPFLTYNFFFFSQIHVGHGHVRHTLHWTSII